MLRNIQQSKDLWTDRTKDSQIQNPDKQHTNTQSCHSIDFAIKWKQSGLFKGPVCDCFANCVAKHQS